MLQLDQVTSAPKDVKVSIKTAVWIAIMVVNYKREGPMEHSYSYVNIQQSWRPSEADLGHTLSSLPSIQAFHFLRVRSHDGRKLPMTATSWSGKVHFFPGNCSESKLTRSATLCVCAGAPLIFVILVGWWGNRLVCSFVRNFDGVSSKMITILVWLVGELSRYKSYDVPRFDFKN